MNHLRFVLGIIALLIACGASRGNEWQRMPLGPAEPEGIPGQSLSEFGEPTVVTVAPFSRVQGQTRPGWAQQGRRAEDLNKDMPKEERRQSFPRLKSLFGRIRGQG